MAQSNTRPGSNDHGNGPTLELTQEIQSRGNMKYRPKVLAPQIQVDEGRPFLIIDSKYLQDGIKLSIVPPRDSREEKCDLVMETPDVTYRLTHGMSFLPRDFATNFFNGIATEGDFDLCREMYFETLRKAEEKRSR